MVSKAKKPLLSLGQQLLDTRKSQRTIPAPLEAGSMAQVLRADRSLPAAGPGKGWRANRIFERLGSLTFERECRVVRLCLAMRECDRNRKPF